MMSRIGMLQNLMQRERRWHNKNLVRLQHYIMIALILNHGVTVEITVHTWRISVKWITMTTALKARKMRQGNVSTTSASVHLSSRELEDEDHTWQSEDDMAASAHTR